MKFRSTPLLLALALGLSGRAPAQGLFTNLHSFVYTNGTGPVATLIAAGNTLYGTARTGGENGFFSGYGSVFKINTDGFGFNVVRVFTNGPDGGNLESSLVLAGSTLYGPAAFGGASNHGTLFGINTNGTGLTNLFNFPAASATFPYTNGPGTYPAAGLLLAGNTFYGSGNNGGAFGWGTIFAVNTNGSGFTNLHSFNFTDGQYPSAPLTLSSNLLYGTTAAGGANGIGALFQLSTNGTGYTNFYSFSPPGGYPYTNSDGASPLGSLVPLDGSLYGTASSGGSNACGTVFKVNPDGSGFTALHQFGGMSGPQLTNSDGANPQSGLLLFSNQLYGTAANGGKAGNGTVFQLNLDGSGFTTLYHFSDTNNPAGTNTDGAHPFGGLVQSGGMLFGTASAGGTAAYGTVFSLLPPPPLFITLNGTNVIVSWPTNVTSFSLQSNTNLLTTNWSAVSGQYAVTNPATGKLKFYRLMHP